MATASPASFSVTFDTPAMAAFRSLALTRRSVRVYDGREVPHAVTRDLIDIATRAPSNINRQPWQFVVADEPRWTQAVVDLLRSAVDAVAEEDRSGELCHLLDHVRAWLYPLETSPVLVLAFYKPTPEHLDRQLSSILGGGDVSLYNPNLLSLGMAIENLLLAAHAQGLGACMHSGPVAFLRGVVNRLLRLPPNLQFAGLISLGYPAEVPEVPRHRDLDRVLTFLTGDVPASWTERTSP